jgi:hypothetical protein
MKNIKFTFKSLTVLLLSLVLLGCQKDEFDGLSNVDAAPSAAITFPESTGGANGLPILEDNAYIIKQNSIASGSVSVKIRVAGTEPIKSISVAGVRFRGPITAPSHSPAVPTGAEFRAPSSTFNRATAPNLGTNLAIGPGTEVTYTIPVNALPALLNKAGTAAAPVDLGAVKVGDAFRFFFRVKLANDTEHRAVEVRVVVTG